MKIIITESQLNILKENDDNITKIVEYVKSFGTKGKLPSFSGRLKDYYKPYMKQAYDWCCENGQDNIERYGFPYFCHMFDVYVQQYFKLNKRDLIYVERSIDLDMSSDLNNLDFKSVGECWAWKKNCSKSYCSNYTFMDNNIHKIKLCGYVHPDSIDWLETIYLNSYDMKNEVEIRMNDNALVEISYIKYDENKINLKGSYLLNASADKYNKNKNW